jgi:hypothetical protein
VAGYCIPRKLFGMHFKRSWVVAVVIIFLYFCSYQGGEGLAFLYKSKTYIKQGTNFGLLICVACAGWYGLSNELQKWVQTVWLAVYLVIIFILATLGIIDLCFPITNPSFRDMFGYLRLFFTSPVPYGILLFLAKKVPRERERSPKN